MFHTAKDEDIKTGGITDVYFVRTVEILERKGVNKHAKAEVILKSFPKGWRWGVLAGVEEVGALLQGLPIHVEAMEEGAIFDVNQPVMVLEGKYVDYAVYETALLGLLCQASGIATKAARCKKAADGRMVISFGARRMHPAIAPMIERNAFLGGCDGVAVIKSAELIEEDPMGTMPHALILMLGDCVEAAKAFHELIDKKVRRVVLVDTFFDEKQEAVRAAEALGKDLFAVRLDTPASRRGNFLEILKEVRWELDYRGYRHVKLFVSGGIDEEEILQLNQVVDAYGVGTSISNAPVMDFALDIVEIEGNAIAKRGKMSGSKKVLRCRACKNTIILPLAASGPPCPCGGDYESLLKPLIKDGVVVREFPKVQTIRRRVLQELERLSLS
ncbi:MAG: nicotinate phosphoribosyltransferase [candidate division NC10 bacterium]|nr:nicotinate phosphoribosyltransferase [candidate division NC10 bacterium]